MRHRKAGRNLGRTKSHRKATLASLATALFKHKKIKTTTAKAKEARSYAEKLITFAKKGDLNSRRQVLRKIREKAVVKLLFDEIAPVYENRNGGYTRVIKLGQRSGDGAFLSILELVDFEDAKKKHPEKSKKGLRERFTKSKKQKSEEPEPVEESKEEVEPDYEVIEETPDENAEDSSTKTDQE